jgi:large subunit ribosomal protein L3
MGSGTFPGRVLKGKKLPGHGGMRTVSIKNVKVVAVDSANNLLMLKGGVPGARSSIIRIEEA